MMSLLRTQQWIPQAGRRSRFPIGKACWPSTSLPESDASSASSALTTTSAAKHSNMTYIDHWFDSIRKPQSFYDDQLEADEGKIRRYFYNIDMQGRLFLEETSPKNIATSIKDEKFLNFFFSRIRPANETEREYLTRYDMQEDYPFVSLCGVELNYIRPAAMPIVFHTYHHHPQDSDGGTLQYGGNLEQAFDSTQLAISAKTGRLYHRFAPPNKKKKATRIAEGEQKRRTMMMAYGLIRSSVAVALSEKIVAGDNDDDDDGSTFFYNDEHMIEWLVDEYEPGRWAMPDDGTMG